MFALSDIPNDFINFQIGHIILIIFQLNFQLNLVANTEEIQTI